MKMNLNQLVEMIRVLQRYSKEDWRNLAETLKDDSTRAQLIELAELLSIPRRQPKLQMGAQVRGQNHDFRPLLATSSLDKEKLKRLKDLQMGIQNKRIFSSTKELREFALSLGLKLSPKYSRERISHELIEHLASLPANEIESKMLKHQTGQRDYGQEYEKWVNLILGTRTKNGAKNEQAQSD
jgi:hypothetical protein